MDQSCQHVTAVDSNIFRPTFGVGDQMRGIISDIAYEKTLIEVEIVLAKVQAQLHIIPKKAADDIATRCTFDKLDRARLRADMELTGLPIWGLTRQLTEMAGAEDSGRYIHWGLNTHDIMDLAQALQMKQALVLVGAQLNEVRDSAVTLIHTYRSTPLIGRTHLQHGLPITFGYRVAVWLSSLDRHVQRLSELKSRVLLAEVGGACGTLASMYDQQDGRVESDAVRVTKALVRELELYEAPIPWHAARDGLAEVASFLALVAGSLAKIALDVTLMQMPEIGEVAEPFVPHRGASSTMPHKNNPILCESILACHKLSRQEAALAFEALPADFERAGTGAWHVEWSFIPNSFMYCSSALQHTTELLRGLRVFPENMLRNLHLSKGLVTAEHFVIALSGIHGRAKVHDILYECCRRVHDTNQTFVDVLKEDARVTDHLSRDQINWYCDPANYMGLTQTFIDRVLAGR